MLSRNSPASMKFEPSSAVAHLRANWKKLADVDKAEAIGRILAAGMSKRAVAREVNCSEGIVRHLAIAAAALPGEKQLARQGKLSTRALVNRVQERRKLQAKLKDEKEERGRAAAVETGKKEILAWLSAEGLSSSHAAQITQEAKRQLWEAEEHGKLPKDRPPKGTPVKEIIKRCCPPEDTRDEFSFVARYAYWLALWTFYAIPDTGVRDRALELAWDRLRG